MPEILIVLLKALWQASTASLHIFPIRYLMLSTHSILCNPIYWQHHKLNTKSEEQADLRKIRSYKKYGLEFKQLIDLIKCRDTRWRLRVLLYKTLISNTVLCSKQTWTHWTFRGPCILMYSYNKSQRDALFLKFILIKNSTCYGHI